MDKIDVIQMKKEEAENLIKFFTEIQTCEDKRSAFIKGVLYGLGFANSEKTEPNWNIIKKIIQKGNDKSNWIDIEKNIFDINRKVYNEHLKMWLDLSKKE